MKEQLEQVKKQLQQPKPQPKPQPERNSVPTMKKVMQSWTIEDWRKAKA